jgi:hypothetical protein
MIVGLQTDVAKKSDSSSENLADVICGGQSMEMKSALYLLLPMLLGCGPKVTAGMMLLQSLNRYHAETEQLEQKPDRWAYRQSAKEWLKTQYRTTIGPSREFDRLADLDFKRRELVIALKDPALKPERAVEIKKDLVEMDKDIDALKEAVKAQLANAELRSQEPSERIVALATLGYLNLRIHALSSRNPPGPSMTVAGTHTLTDHGSFSTLSTPEGKTYRCSFISLGEDAVSIKCE